MKGDFMYLCDGSYSKQGINYAEANFSKTTFVSPMNWTKNGLFCGESRARSACTNVQSDLAKHSLLLIYVDPCNANLPTEIYSRWVRTMLM